MTDDMNQKNQDRLRAFLAESTAYPPVAGLEDRLMNRLNRRRIWIAPFITGGLVIATASAIAVVALASHGPQASVPAPAASASPTAVSIPSASASPSATPAPTPTVTPAPPALTQAQLIAVAEQAYLPDGSTCSNASGYAACPFSPALRARYQAFAPDGQYASGSGSGYSFLCQCQIDFTPVTYTATVTPTGGTVLVHTGTGPATGTSAYDFTLTIVTGGGLGVVSDITVVHGCQGTAVELDARTC